MNPHAPLVRPAQIVFLFWIILFSLILVNGYALNLLNLPASPPLLFVLVAVQGGLAALTFVRGRPRIVGDPLEFAGFLIVVVAAFLYFLYPAWPTLLPPSYSGDGALHTGTVFLTFDSGRIINDLPGGPPLIAATVAHWLGWLPVRVTHLLGALWMALTTGGIYGLACAMLPDRREFKTIALLAPFALFVPWNYFPGGLMGPQYFWTQAAAQFFFVAFVWFLVLYVVSPARTWVIGMALSLLAISVSHQFFLVLTGALFVWAISWNWYKGRLPGRTAFRDALTIWGALALSWCAIFLFHAEWVPRSSRVAIDAPVLSPSFEALGGWFLFLPALGILALARRREHTGILGAWAVLVVLETLGLILGRLTVGFGVYWIKKSVYLYVFPLALLAVWPAAVVLERLRHTAWPRWLASLPIFVLTCLSLMAGVIWFVPPFKTVPLSESVLEAALWARDHLDTHHVHLVGSKNLMATWIAMGIWNESFPDDLFLDFVALGPKTFEEWRNDPGWGEYLLVPDTQRQKLDPGLKLLYQSGDSAIVGKPADPHLQARPVGNFGDWISLDDYDLPERSLRAGEVLTVPLRLTTLQVPKNEVAWRLQLRDLDHNAAAEARMAPFGNKYPLQRWPNGLNLSQTLSLPLAADLPPGLYNLELGLVQVRDGEAQHFAGPASAPEDVLVLGRVKIAVPPVTTHELGSLTRTDWILGNAFRLLGYRVIKQSPVRPGDSLQLVLYWQDTTQLPEDYTVFVHLLDSSGVLTVQRDNAPRSGTYPTSSWEPGEIVGDAYRLTIPADAAPGEYSFEIGMYRWPSLERLHVTGPGSDRRDDRIILPTRVQVTLQ